MPHRGMPPTSSNNIKSRDNTSLDFYQSLLQQQTCQNRLLLPARGIRYDTTNKCNRHVRSFWGVGGGGGWNCAEDNKYYTNIAIVVKARRYKGAPTQVDSLWKKETVNKVDETEK